MTRSVVAAGLLLWAGLTLLLSGTRHFSRPRLAERLGPYHPGPGRLPAAGQPPTASLREMIVPVARSVGDRLAGVFGVAEPAEVRLRRIHSPISTAGFRVKQMAWTGAALGGSIVVASVARPPLPLDVLLVLGAPLLAFLVIEQRLAGASERWQDSVVYELPVVTEQLAMLLSAGYSLGAALNRISQRGTGCCARDLAAVVNRIRQGVGEAAALGEWAEVARVDAVTRLVSVLSLNSEASDLARLVAVEAAQARHEVHRRTLETIERRSQQVWVPVTVATLVPGVILIAVPFLAALHSFSNA